MKKILFVIVCFAFISTNAQTADEVIQKHAKAMGGLSAFNAIKTIRMTGTVKVQGMELPITVQVINGKAVRTDVDAMGQSVIKSYKDGKGWKIDPFSGVATATDLTNEELIDSKGQTRLANQLMDYKARGHKVELQGQEDVEGIKCYKIKLTNKDDSKVTTYYISVADNTLVKSVTTRDMQGQQVEVETYSSDIKEHGGIKFPMTRTQKVQGQVLQEIKLTLVELNVAIDEKVFDKQQ
ncbi:MAG TPA: hypothetical protein VFH08_05585 [Chitinophagaceae bacterium]|nr:hypothetical protein [Chitinophagaceae bacterium]